MWLDLLVFSALLNIGLIYFGHFNDLLPTWRRILKTVFLYIMIAIVSAVIGHWSIVFTVALMGIGLAFHVWWCKKYEIHPLTAEPRAKFEALIREQMKLAQTS